MPGQPSALLGSRVASAALALALTAVLIAVVRVVDHRGVEDRTVVSGLVGLGLGYAVVALGVWAAAHVMVGPPFPADDRPALLAGWVLVSGLALGVQVAAPAAIAVRWGYWTAWLAVALNGFAGLYAFQFVGGETDVIGLWPILFAPILLGATTAVVALEALVRWLRR